MNTAILRIAAPAAGAQDYDITLMLRDEAGQEQPLAATTCPVTLQPPGMAGALPEAALVDRFAAAQGQDEVIRTIGVQLHALIAGVGAALAALPAATSVLLDIEPPALRRLPWELLWDEGDHRALFLDAQRPVCRGHLDAALQPASLEWPVRMLVVVGAQDDDKAALPQPEVERIWHTLAGREADVDLLVRRRPRRADLVAEIRTFQPHILHFIGHGGADDADSDAYLELDSDPPGPKQAWTATEIRNDLSQVRGLRLVFLNACRTSAAGMNGLWTVADAFLKCGVAAVVSTRADVIGADACLVASTFYAALAEGEPVDVAAAAARQRIDQEYGGSLKRREWGALCLQVQTPPAAVLSLDNGVPARQRKFVKLNLPGALNKVNNFVNRVPERRATWQGVRREDEPHLLAVIGESKVGKTALAQLLLVRCALTGWTVRYVDLGMEREQNFLRVLHLLRTGAPAAEDLLLAEALPDDVFAEFDQLLAQIAGPLAPGAPPPDVVRQPANAQKLLAAYIAGLDKAAEQGNEQHMLLVLDHLYAIPASEFRILRQHFLRSHLANDKSRLRIVLLLRPEDFAAFQLAEFDDLVERVDLSRLPLQTWDELAFQYLLRQLGATAGEDDIRALVEGSRKLLGNTSWTPDKLDGTLRFAQMLMGLP